MRHAASALFLLLLSLTSLQAQVPYIETLDVRVHGIDVVVTDAQGRPVTGLRKEDFELFEDGQRREITNFSSFSATRGQPGGEPVAPQRAEEQVRPSRKFLFFIDEMALVEHTQKTLARELDQLATTLLQPGDEAMILRPAEKENRLVLTFTGDRDAVRRELAHAIDKETWRATGPIARERRQFEIELRGNVSARSRRIAARRWADFVRRRVQQRMGQLKSLVNAAAEIEGRKVLVLVTESLPIAPGREAFYGSLDPTDFATASDEGTPFAEWNTVSDFLTTDWVDLTPLIEEIARNAATNGITIYSVQAEYDLASLAPGGDVGALRGRSSAESRRSSSAGTPTGAVNTRMTQHAITNTEQSLRLLADKTGGAWGRGAFSIDDVADGIARDLSTYYSLGYRAGEEVDRARTVEVRVKGRPELRVRARTEVIRKSPEREMTDRVVAGLLDPPDGNELAIRLESKRVGLAADAAYATMYFAARVPLSTLTFLPDGDQYKAKFTVHYAAMGEDSDFVSGQAGTQEITVPAAQFDAAKETHYTYVVPMNLRRTKHTVVIGVLDSLSHLSGFARTDVMVN